VKLSKARQRSVSCDAFSPKFEEMRRKVGLISGVLGF